MCRSLCVLWLFVYVRLAHSFPWDIVISRDNCLEFYDEGTFIYTACPTIFVIEWITYDPFNDRVLFTETGYIPTATELRPVFSYDIATNKVQTLFNLKLSSWKLVYDPPREVLFANIVQGNKSMQSFLVNPESGVESKGTYLVNLQAPTNSLVVDSCRGNIYWTTFNNCTIEKVRFDGTDSEVLDDGCKDSTKTGLTIDPQTQKLYWAEKQENITYYFSSDLNGKNKRAFYNEEGIEAPNQMTVTNYFIYWLDLPNLVFWQLPKDIPSGTNVKPKQFALYNRPTVSLSAGLASKYLLEGQSLGNPECKALKSLVPSYSTTTESRASGDTCDVPVCHNYCLKGNCSTSTDGQPKCRCDADYSGLRCEVDLCMVYCYTGQTCDFNLCLESCYSGEQYRCGTSVSMTKLCQQLVERTNSMLT